MKYGKKLLFLPLILTSFVICLFAYSLISAHAQEGNYDVTVSPVFFDLSVNPGGSVSDQIRVRNNTQQALPIKIEVKRMTGDELGDLTFTDENSDNSLDWISFEEEEITLPPLEYTSIPFSINAPEDASYGYYYGISLTQSGSKSETTGAAISGAATIPVLLTVRKDGAQASLELEEFEVGSFIYDTLPVDFKVRLANKGNVHVRPRGNIFISGMGKENITSIDVNPGGAAIIPNTARDFLASWTDGFIVREVTVIDGKEVNKLKFNWSKITDIRFGKYTANLFVVYDDGQRDIAIEDSKAFWVIPWKSIVVIVVVIVALILIVRWALRRYINREVSKRTK